MYKPHLMFPSEIIESQIYLPDIYTNVEEAFLREFGVKHPRFAYLYTDGRDKDNPLCIVRHQNK